MSLPPSDIKRLMDAAKQVAAFSYSPYSQFAVGAALLLKDRQLITGTNVENASYGLTMCAERSALFSAVSQNKIKEIQAVGLWAKNTPNHSVTPCGACRQVMLELLDSNIPVFYFDNSGQVACKAVEAWLPDSFSL